MPYSKRKILFLTHSSRIAGAEIVLQDLAQAFSNATVFLFEDGPLRAQLVGKGIEVIVADQSRQDLSTIRRDNNLFMASIPVTGAICSLVKQISQHAKQYDIIYANSQKSFVLAAAASMLARRPLVWHCHDILTNEHFSRTHIRLDIALANNIAKLVVFPSQACASAFIAAGGRPARAKVLYSGIQPPALNRKDNMRAMLRETLGISDSFTFGVFSRLSPWKGQHVAIEALQGLPDAKCIIVGASQFGEEHYERHLHSLAEQLGVKDRVMFLGHRNDVADIMAAVDAYCHPSTSPEPFGMAVLEAMREGLPIVATNAGGIPELIQQDVTGILVERNSPTAIAQALEMFMNHPQRAAYMGQQAKEVANSRFTIQQMHNSVREIVGTLQ
jgi:glycosyltransferase involved in cell wall biosynthesis